MYLVNVIEVRIWLQILPDLHWPLVERPWEGNNEALAKPRGLLVPLTAVIFLMSRDQKSSSPPVLPCSSRQKKAKNPLQSSLQVKKASLPYKMNSPGAGWGRGWRTRRPPLVSYTGKFAVLNPHSVPLASGVSVRLGSTLNPNLGCVAQGCRN